MPHLLQSSFKTPNGTCIKALQPYKGTFLGELVKKCANHISEVRARETYLMPQSIRARFNQADFKCYPNLQDLLLKEVT